MTADFKRAYIMNKGSNTVSVINAQTNALDSFAGSSAPGTIAVGTAPVWADFATTRSELVVANAGTGSNQGSLSVISVPLCNAAAAVTNPNCDATNPVDASGFGTVLASVPVGVNPVNVAVLADGSRAYVANGGDPGLPCATVPVARGLHRMHRIGRQPDQQRCHRDHPRQRSSKLPRRLECHAHR